MSTPAVRLLRSPSGRTVVVAPAGEQDVSTVPDLHDALQGASGSGARAVVVDLQAVSFVEARTVGELVRAHRELAAAGRDLLVINVAPRVVHALRLLDRARELRVVPLERLLTPAWLEDGALSPPRDPAGS